MKTGVEPTTRWGRPRFGGSPSLLVGLSVIGGTIGALGLAWILHAVRGEGEFWVYFLASIASSFPVFSALTWAILVDRQTITGAIRCPDESVENRWFAKASETTLLALLVILGLAIFYFVLFPQVVSVQYVLLAILLLIGLIFFVSYEVHKRRS